MTSNLPLMDRLRLPSLFKDKHLCERCRKLRLNIDRTSTLNAIQSKAYKILAVPLSDPRTWSLSCELCDILRRLARYHESEPLGGHVFYLVPGVPWYFGGPSSDDKTRGGSPICWTVYKDFHLLAKRDDPSLTFESLLKSGLESTDLWLCPLPKPDNNTRDKANTIALDSFADLGVVKEWLKECESSHSRCWVQSEHVRNHLSLEGLTFRVINCAEKKIIPLPRNTQYLTLSYRWGAASADEDDVPDGQLPTRFPKAIHDAMKATLGLGFKYLWIDRYCIYQSDPRDKEIQISRMGAIYSSSFATIVAAAGEDPTFGLPGISPRPSSRVLKKEKSTWVITPMSRTAVKESTWNTRGWTYQEAVLSLRLICFLPQQIYFECRQCCLIESVSFPDSTKGIIVPHIEPLFSMYTTKSSALEQGHGGLYGHIEKYTYRELTMPNDILNGISGVFEDICSQESGFHFISGVPTISGSSFTVNSQSTLKTPAQHFASSLCWIKIGPAQRREGFPSWSWAGWYLPVARSFGALMGHEGGDILQISVDLNWPDIDSDQTWTNLAVFLEYQKTKPECTTFVHRIRIESLLLPRIHFHWEPEQRSYLGKWTASIDGTPHGTIQAKFYPNEPNRERRARKPYSSQLDGGTFPGLILGVYRKEQPSSPIFSFDVLVFEEDSNGNAERVTLVEFKCQDLSAWLVNSLNKVSIILA